tara:strand:+ start:80 stop:1096 length:1017 start_codon:yes stop_codon:yes gene_type:complete
MKKVLIIAEAGVNHNGSIETAKKMIDVAVDAGVDFVKFQTFKTELAISRSAVKADYQVSNTGNNESQFDMVKKLELDQEAHRILINYCELKGIKFLSTAFDLVSIDLLVDLGISLFKIPSGEVTNLPYLRKIGVLGFPIILSTGMCDMGDIESALSVLIEAGAKRKDITILHCNTEYPTPMEDVNLNAMLSIGKEFETDIGYSDHTLGIEVPIAAVAMGAICIEKHFTLDCTMEGPDHVASLEPNELKSMVSAIRNIESALGSSRKEPSPSETKNIAIARKSIHTSRDLISGHTLTSDDLIMKRPGDGISPMNLDSIIGMKVKSGIVEDQKLKYSDLI